MCNTQNDVNSNMFWKRQVEQYVQNLLNYTTVSNFNPVIVKMFKYEN